LVVFFIATSMLVGRLLFAMPPSRGDVRVVVAGDDRSFGVIAKSLTESLSFIGVTPQFDRVASVDPRRVAENHPLGQTLLARLWIDAATDREVTLYITDADTLRVFVRRITLDLGLDTVAVEGLAFVAQSSLEALLAGKLIGMTRDDFEHYLDVAAARTITPAPVVEKSAAPPPEPKVAYVAAVPSSNWHLVGGYELQGWDRTTLRHELDLGIDYERRSLRFGMNLFGTLPIQFHSGDSGASLFSGGTRLTVSRPFAPTRELRLVPGLGFAVELTRIRSELSAPYAQPASSYFALDPTVRAALGIERSWGRWSLRALCGADFAIRSVQYVITREAATETVATPWRVRPFVSFAVAAPF
jgi:hypothetical protein